MLMVGGEDVQHLVDDDALGRNKEINFLEDFTT